MLLHSGRMSPSASDIPAGAPNGVRLMPLPPRCRCQRRLRQKRHNSSPDRSEGKVGRFLSGKSQGARDDGRRAGRNTNRRPIAKKENKKAKASSAHDSTPTAWSWTPTIQHTRIHTSFALGMEPSTARGWNRRATQPWRASGHAQGDNATDKIQGKNNA